jgi:hypothetical protein
LVSSPEALRRILAGFAEMELRLVKPQPPEAPAFCVPFPLTALFQRPTVR